jgi:molecular chaperone GrpE
MSDSNEHQDKRGEAPQETEDHTQENLESMTEEELIAALSQDQEDALHGLGDGLEPGDGEGFANPLQALAAENTRQEAEIKELNDRLLRAAAEMENLRRRTQKDVADARDFSISKFARDMLSVADNLRRAIEHVPEEEKEQAGLKTLFEGVEMTERELLNVLEKNGVKQINPVGEKFDPNFHQAMFEVQNPDVANNTVAQVVQVGFVIGSRVLRPAMVGVAKGGPKAAANTDQGTAG